MHLIFEGGDGHVHRGGIEPYNKGFIGHFKAKDIVSSQWKILIDMCNFDFIVSKRDSKHIRLTLLISIFRHVVKYECSFFMSHR